MAATLLQALVQWFDDDARLTSRVPAGLWIGTVPETIPALPFVALLHGGEVPDWTFEPVYSEMGTVSFLVFQGGWKDAEALASLLKRVFDPAVLDVARAVQVSLRRTGYHVGVEDEYRAADGAVVYRAQLDYASELRKTL